MAPIEGDYPVPTSEAAYRAHLNLIDVALPTHAGWLNADGSWTRFPLWVNNDWARELPGLARRARHQYIPVLNPGHGTVGDNLMAVLDSDRSVWEASTDEVVEMALTDFDAPWDGVVYDAIGFTRATLPDYIDRQQEYMALLSEKVRGAGLVFGAAAWGQDPDYWGAELDMGLLAAGCDTFEYYFVRYRAQPPSIGPYWWIDRELGRALAGGMSPTQLYVGIGNFAAYYPEGSEDLAEYHAITYDQAMSMVEEYGSTVEWIERNDSGLVREWRALLGEGLAWISGGDTVRHRLGLADKHGLAGMMLFIPGMGDESVWRAIAKWRGQMTLSTLPTMYGNSDLFITRGRGQRRCR